MMMMIKMSTLKMKFGVCCGRDEICSWSKSTLSHNGSTFPMSTIMVALLSVKYQTELASAPRLLLLVLMVLVLELVLVLTVLNTDT